MSAVERLATGYPDDLAFICGACGFRVGESVGDDHFDVCPARKSQPRLVIGACHCPLCGAEVNSPEALCTTCRRHDEAQREEWR